MKNEILKHAVTLFNEQGINKTSFRDIAESLQISDGHVRYYFKTKEILLMSIFDRLDHEIIEAAKIPAQLEQDIYALLMLNIEQIFQLAVKYRFLFVESPKTIGQSPNLLKSYRNLMGRRKEMIYGAFKAFDEMHLFHSGFDLQAREYAFYTIFIVSDGWMRTFLLTNTKEPDKKAIKFHSNLIMQILKPYLKI
ncbi:MAG: TetR/AcrR family transcriptional regulator [Bacteroidetes bacterium]|nr:TetR/AcrR family transcriptional regulator [Bacteroidota bacterium]